MAKEIKVLCGKTLHDMVARTKITELFQKIASLEKNGVGKPGKDGVGIASVEQTSTSTTDGGINIVTVKKTDGSSSTFEVRNGSRGSKGDTGETGPQGPKGDTGSQGVQGIQGEQGPKGNDGTSVTIVSITQSSESGGSSIVTFSDGKTLEIKNGNDVLLYEYLQESGFVGRPEDMYFGLADAAGAIWHANMVKGRGEKLFEKASVYDDGLGAALGKITLPTGMEKIIVDYDDRTFICDITQTANGVEFGNGSIYSSSKENTREPFFVKELNGSFLAYLEDKTARPTIAFYDFGLTYRKIPEEFLPDGYSDGYSPKVNVASITGGHRITITDVDGIKTFDVMDGEKGATGATGPKGDKGDTGATGPTGPKGADGYTPQKGVDYFDGVKGDKGDKGDTGAQGIQGEQGPKGDTGATGPKGSDGTPCTHSWNGTTLTVNSASGTSSANLKGEKGDKGDKGDTGSKGDKGDTGSQGIQGVKGDTGAKGETGEKGDTGVGIASVKQTVTSTADSGINEITVTMTDGTKSKFQVRNGSGTGFPAYDYAQEAGFTGTPEEFYFGLANSASALWHANMVEGKGEKLLEKSSVYDDGLGASLGKLTLPTGMEKIIVDFNGVSYICSITQHNYGVQFGNANIFSSSNADTGEPFFIKETNGYANAYLKDKTARPTIALYDFGLTYNKLPKEFLPDDIPTSGGGGSADWSQNDENGAGYVKNRTHWIEKDVVVFPETTLPFVNGQYFAETSVNLVEGHTYKVTFDGVDYVCEAGTFSMNGMNGVGIGNLALFGLSSNSTGEPFLLGTNGPYFNGVINTGADSATIKITTDEYHKLDKKFIHTNVQFTLINTETNSPVLCNLPIAELKKLTNEELMNVLIKYRSTLFFDESNLDDYFTSVVHPFEVYRFDSGKIVLCVDVSMMGAIKQAKLIEITDTEITYLGTASAD